jgi:hypothetical protein
MATHGKMIQAPEDVPVTRGPTKVARGANVKQLRLTSRAKGPKTAKPANGAAETKPLVKVKAMKVQTESKVKAARVTPGRAKGDFTNDQKITLAKKPEDGFLLGRYGLLKTGMTVADALAAFTAKNLHRRRSSLRSLIEGGFVTVK